MLPVLTNELVELFRFVITGVGVPEVCPRVIVIGALGRCGKGAIKMAHKVGIPE